jgi:hypothetical protein
MTSSASDRLVWAVEMLDVQPDDLLLEDDRDGDATERRAHLIGQGPGAPRRPGGRLVMPVLTSGGTLYLINQPLGRPADQAARRFADEVTGTLRDHGLNVTRALSSDSRVPGGVCLIARRS